MALNCCVNFLLRLGRFLLRVSRERQDPHFDRVSRA